MPLYMDVHHNMVGLTDEAAASAHQQDLTVQHKYGVRYLNYWYDKELGKVFCLVEAPRARKRPQRCTVKPTGMSRTRFSRSSKATSEEGGRGPMQCPQCHYDAPVDAVFCPECGSKLTLLCAHCQTTNAPGHKFCKQCGQPLATPSASAPTPSGTTFASPQSYTPKYLAEKILTSRSALEGERKEVTILFCDVVESSRIAEQLDPEAMHQIMDHVLRLMAEAIHRYEGTVNQFLGDGLMALFGAPVALEDHALRAVLAALMTQETISAYNEELKSERGVEIRLRLGLNTGLVVVGRIGDDLRMDYTAVGDTTNVAARMQSMAEPGTILIAEATHRLVDGYVRSEAQGPMQVKGRSKPVRVYRVSGRRGGRSRLEVSVERGLTPLVGRERELNLLHNCLTRSKAGRGQVVGIVGEPGVGKSRLLYEFRKALKGEHITWLEGHCVAYGQNTPYLPILEILRTNFQIEDGDTSLQIRENCGGASANSMPASKGSCRIWASCSDFPWRMRPWRSCIRMSSSGKRSRRCGR